MHVLYTTDSVDSTGKTNGITPVVLCISFVVLSIHLLFTAVLNTESTSQNTTNEESVYNDEHIQGDRQGPTVQDEKAFVPVFEMP